MRAKTFSMSALVPLCSSTSGNRTRGEIRFITLKACLTGAGWLSRESAAVNLTSTAASCWARVISPSIQAEYMARQRPGGCGRDASYLAPPAQIRTCSFPAYGSHLGYPRQLYGAVCEPASLTRLCGAESGACVAGPHSPWSPPFAPPAPQRFAPLCSSASQLLWRSATSRARASSATAPHLPDADRPSHSTLTASHEISQLPTRSFCA